MSKTKDIKEQSEVVKRERTDNAMFKTKDTKGQSEVVKRGRTDNATKTSL
jgi:hypothetical protein